MSHHELNRAMAAVFERRMAACKLTRRELAERVKLPQKTLQAIAAGNAVIHPAKLGSFVRALELRDDAERQAFIVLALNRFASKDQETAPIIREHREVLAVLRSVVPPRKPGTSPATLKDLFSITDGWEYVVPGAGTWFGMVHPFPHDQEAQRIYPAVYDIRYADSAAKRTLFVDCHYGTGPQRLIQVVQATVLRIAAAHPLLPDVSVTITRVTAAELTSWTLWVMPRDGRSFHCIQMPGDGSDEGAEPTVVAHELPPATTWYDPTPLPTWEASPVEATEPRSPELLDDPASYALDDGWQVLSRDEDAGAIESRGRTVPLRGGARYRILPHDGYDIDDEPAAAAGLEGELVAVCAKRGLASLRPPGQQAALTDIALLDPCQA